jgi:hypothetical protein
MRRPIDAALEHSSLGSPVARKLRRRTPTEVRDRVVRRVNSRDSHGPDTKSETPVSSVISSQGDQGLMVDRRTSSKAAKAASSVLRDGRTSSKSKTAAGSALSQRARKGGTTKR